ncbi:MAG: hypothetical protein B7C54_12655 [Acidimicrobiales bacterium mtb01]|nr:sigma-70 family RNA polymerase sigma factor [Actinomycetota bacterium]TEX45876.1 MAG: hypothetical protein B7C54_12655 [Acidimicrobiales bacterium mtb01]
MTEPLDQVERLRNGDGSAWSQFVRSVNTRVSHYARHRGHPDPDDVVGATLEAVVRTIHRFDGGARDLWSFVFVVAHARVVDAWRRGGRFTPIDYLDDVATSVENFDGSMSDDVVELLAVLDDERRAIIEMRYVEGLPTREIAERLGKSDVATRAIVSRSLDILRQEMQKTPPETGGVF